MKHTVVAMLEDRPGVLNRVVSLFRKRGFNIQSLTVGPTEIPELSRMTVVVDGDDAVIEQVVKQLYKVIDVVKVSDLTSESMVARELAMIKVAATSQSRSEIMQVADIFRAKIIDVGTSSIIIEVTGTEEKIDALIQLVRGFGIKELVRTGRVAMMRGGLTSRDDEPAPAPITRSNVRPRAVRA
ncbi:MAG TPA: acetolactate synthase small subunit, partial [Dehalococcoidia bacterium]|nr:acetolactate synthase small subunit [Dehalococcoidia bacterium]